MDPLFFQSPIQLNNKTDHSESYQTDESMSTHIEAFLTKKTPCNGCRARKRKCTYEQPCARCAKSGVECTYTVMPSPKDLEYMRELEYMKQIDSIQHQITCMENELSILKLARENEVIKAEQCTNASKDYPSPVSLGKPSSSFEKQPEQPTSYDDRDHQGIPPPPSRPFSSDHDEEEEYDRKGYLHHDLVYPPACHPAYKKGRKKHCQTVLKADNIEANLSKESTDATKAWVLTIKNGNMTIDTHINSFSELMSSMPGMISSAVYQQKTSNLPFPLNKMPRSSQGNAISVVMTILIWRKYGKSRFKSITKYTPTLLHCNPPQYTTDIVSIQDLNAIVLRLVFTYFQCLHLQHLNIYIPEFIRQFMNHQDSITESPVVMALCSVICQQGCRHICHILPKDSLSDYGLYFFEQARELIADKFDEVNLETYCTYTYMAIYKLKTRNDSEAKQYLSIADRLYELLLPQYDLKPQGSSPSEESFLFHRAHHCIAHCHSVLEIHYLTENMFKVRGIGPRRFFKVLDEHDNRPTAIAPGDSEREVKFIKMRKYLCQLRDTLKDGAQCAAATDLPTFIGIFGHHMEMAMRHWYRNVLPKEFQLSLSLFDDHIGDIDFFTTLEAECADSPIALITTLSLYNEYLIMAKSYVPKSIEELQIDTDTLIRKFKELQYNTEYNVDNRRDFYHSKAKTHHWIKICMKMRYFKRHHHYQFTDDELEESEEEYFIRFIKALNPSKLNLDMPFIHIAIKAALNVVRIVQFLISRDYACFLDLRWIMNAWEIFLRAARCKYQQPDDESVTLDRIRANLILCLDIIKDQIEFSRRDPSGTFVQELEREFEKVFI